MQLVWIMRTERATGQCGMRRFLMMQTLQIEMLMMELLVGKLTAPAPAVDGACSACSACSKANAYLRQIP